MRWTSMAASLTRGLVLAGALSSALGAAACVGEIGDPEDRGPRHGIETEGLAPAPARLRRLLARQYRNSIADLLGAAAAAAVDPPEDIEVNGFESIGAAEL